MATKTKQITGFGKYFWISGREGYVFQSIKDIHGKTHLRVYSDEEYDGHLKNDNPDSEKVFYLTPRKADDLEISGLIDLSGFLTKTFSKLDDRVVSAGARLPIDYSADAVKRKILDYSSSDENYIEALFKHAKKILLEQNSSI